MTGAQDAAELISAAQCAGSPARVWDRLAEVGSQTRETLADLPGWEVADAPDNGRQLGIVRQLWLFWRPKLTNDRDRRLAGGCFTAASAGAGAVSGAAAGPGRRE